MLKLLLFGVVIVIIAAKPPEPENRRVSLADFEFLKLLGSGTSGSVYVVRKDGHLYAMKVMNIKRGYSFWFQKPFLGDFAQRVVNELEISTSVLNHLDFAVHVYYAFIEGVHACIVMDYVSGESLKSKLRINGDIIKYPERYHPFEQPLSEKRAQQILIGVLSLMKRLHENGIVHGDLTLDNILVTSNGKLLLTDFSYTSRFTLKRAITWILVRSSLAIHQTNLDYFRMAREFMWLTNSPYNPDDVYGIMDITDYKTVEALRKNNFFKGVDWMAVDEGIAVFNATECDPEHFTKADHFQLDLSIGKGSLSKKDKKTVRDFYYESNKAPRIL